MYSYMLIYNLSRSDPEVEFRPRPAGFPPTGFCPSTSNIEVTGKPAPLEKDERYSRSKALLLRGCIELLSYGSHLSIEFAASNP